MALPSSARPAYLDNVFHHGPASFNKTPSLRSAHSSISSSASSSSFRTLHSSTGGNRPLSPAYEEDDASDDRASLRSLRLQFSPRRSFRNLLNRRTYPQVKEMVDVEFPTSRKNSAPAAPPATARPQQPHDRRPSTRGRGIASRRPSLPKLHTGFASSTPSFKSQAEMYANKPLPAAPTRTEELRCQPCYYFAARHCNGYVLGGAHGDACENCLAAGFFGAS